jgi:hypothetical protein
MQEINSWAPVNPRESDAPAAEIPGFPRVEKI